MGKRAVHFPLLLCNFSNSCSGVLSKKNSLKSFPQLTVTVTKKGHSERYVFVNFAKFPIRTILENTCEQLIFELFFVK